MHNLSVLKQTAPRAQVIAVLKDDAYGHGAVGVAQRLEGHVALFGVATLAEALVLRQHGIHTPILLMGGVFEEEELAIAEKEKCHVLVHNQRQKAWIDKGRYHLSVWLKANTGMNRLGFLPEEIPDLYKQLSQHKTLEGPVRVLSHFACSDDKEHPLNARQIQRMHELAKQVDTEFSFCNSAATFNFPECHYHYIRPGIVLYGAHPKGADDPSTLNARPVMTLSSQLTAVQMLHKGDSTGYSARFVAQERTPIGIVPIGYGDGFMRNTPLGTPVLVNGIECPIVGGVAMDMTMIDLRPCPTAQVGDPVTLWGPGLPIEQVARRMGRITYDLLTSLQNRVASVWED